MAHAILPEIDWTATDARALELFSTHRNLEMHDAHIAALCELRNADQVRRALRLIEQDGNCSFSQAFKAVRATDAYFDADALPFDDSAPATMPALAPAPTARELMRVLVVEHQIAA